jgi:hypothetical protein
MARKKAIETNKTVIYLGIPQVIVDDYHKHFIYFHTSNLNCLAKNCQLISYIIMTNVLFLKPISISTSVPCPLSDMLILMAFALW